MVYLDEAFLLNGVVDYLLLLCSAKLAGEVLRRGRMALGAAVGALYACAVFLPGLGFLSHPLCKLAAAVGMCLVAFGSSRHLLRAGLTFLGASAAFGGGVFALQLLGAGAVGMKNGVLYSGMDLKVILLSAAGCYLLLTLVFRRTARHTHRELAPAVLSLEGRKTALTALVDTGNTLTDPATGKSVMVAEGDRVTSLFPPGDAPTQAELLDPVGAMERLGAGWRLLPYRAVGVDCGLLLAVKMDRVTVGTEDYGAILVALSPTPLSDGGGYNALVGA